MADFDEKRLTQLDLILQQALDLPREKRESFLSEATTQDPTLYDDIKKLIQYAGESESFFGDTVSDFLAPLLPILEGDKSIGEFTFEESTKIGSYRIKKLIGKGGMGQVYLAERSDGAFKKEAALKCIKKGMDSEEILKRFRVERQILASLQHPNIAQLLDGGLTDEGRPYLVMEYVEGKPIDVYCDDKKLSVNERLKLFKTVCDAVQYAHQKLVIHRDIKPSNILVTEQGDVKLLDFGIARLLDYENAFVTAPITRAGFRLLTPEYAAPEQRSNDQITTATDVYSLGVLLLELLTGPVKSTEWKKSGRPSARVFETDGKTHASTDSKKNQPWNTIAENRSTTPEKLARELRGDLDTIIRAALHEEPIERYNSAALLMADIENYLTDLPVTAKPVSLPYRIQKFIRRHRAGVATTVGFLILLTGFFAVHTTRVTQERNLAIIERDIANTERDKANEVAVFLEDLLSAGDPAYGSERADTLRLRDFVQLSVEKVRNELEGQPAIKAQMLNSLGKVHGKLGLHEQGKSLLEEALKLQLSVHGDEHPEVAASLNDLGIILTRQGEYVEAETYLWKAYEMRQRVSEPRSEDVAGSYTALANLVHNTGDYNQAEEYYRQALNILEQIHGPEHRKTAVAMVNLATILHRRGNLQKAGELHRDALAINRSVLGPDHPLVATSENNLGLLLVETGQFSDAAELIRSALNTRQKLYGKEHPVVLSSMNNLASVMVDMGNYEDGELYYRQSLELRKKIHGEQSMPVAIALNNLADLLRKKGAIEESIAVNRESIEMVTEVVGPNHPAVGIITGNLALKIRLRGEASLAEQTYRHSLSILENTLSPDHPSIARQRVGLAECLADQSRFEEAEDLMLIGYTTLLEKGSDVSSARSSLVRLYEAWDKPNEALRYQSVASKAETEIPD